MEKINEILNKLGISKVKLAKYLGVSRQMVYNYLTFESLDKWPNDKRILLLELFDIEDATNADEALKKIKITSEFANGVEKRLNANLKKDDTFENNFDMSGLSKSDKSLLADMFYNMKEKLVDGNLTNKDTIRYVSYLLQNLDNNPEYRYFLAYVAKACGNIKPDEFIYDETKQFIFEGIMYSGFTLYNNGGASKMRVEESRKRFLKEIEQKKEEKLSRTEQITTIRIQALRELGYDSIDESNASEVIEKIVEIQSRKE